MDINKIELRDYFAAKVLEGTMSNPEATEYLSKTYGNDLDSAFERIAEKSYKLADAMIKEKIKVNKKLLNNELL